MQFVVLLQALNGHQLASIGLYRKHGTGFGRLAIDDNSAGTTAGGIAANMGASQAQIIAKPVDKQRARIDITFVDGSIDSDVI